MGPRPQLAAIPRPHHDLAARFRAEICCSGVPVCVVEFQREEDCEMSRTSVTASAGVVSGSTVVGMRQDGSPVQKREGDMRARISTRVGLAILVLAVVALSALPALAYTNGQQVWSQQVTTVNGTKKMSDFNLEQHRAYDTNGQLLTDCSVRKWGFRVMENVALLPDIQRVNINFTTPIKSCAAIGVRVTLKAVDHHYDVKADGAGATFKGWVIAR